MDAYTLQWHSTSQADYLLIERPGGSIRSYSFVGAHRPADLTLLDEHAYADEDGRTIRTGLSQWDGEERNVAWLEI